MRIKRSQRREIELFNFSFLDILACVIGLLIFVLTIVVISGGGSEKAQRASDVSDAEHQLERTSTEAQMSEDRLHRDEQLLNERSHILEDPQGAADLLRDQIRAIQAETSEFDRASATADNRTASLTATLNTIGASPEIDASSEQIRREIDSLNKRTAATLVEAEKQKEKASANVTHVQYYVPHIREVARKTLWVEIAEDHLWCLDSDDDYERDPIDENSIKFTRRNDAPGKSVSAIVKSDNAIPAEISGADPENTVIEVALRPNGYVAFRAFRDWAWGKGFSVNWTPLDENAIVLRRAAHVFAQ